MTNRELSIYKTTTSLRLAVDRGHVSEVVKFLRELKLEMERQIIKNKKYDDLLSELNEIVRMIKTQNGVVDEITDKQAEKIDRLVHLIDTFYLQHSRTQRTEQSVDAVRKERDFYRQMLVHYSQRFTQAAEELRSEYDQLSNELNRRSEELEGLLEIDVPEYNGPGDQVREAIEDTTGEGSEKRLERIEEVADRLGPNDDGGD